MNADRWLARQERGSAHLFDVGQLHLWNFGEGAWLAEPGGRHD